MQNKNTEREYFGRRKIALYWFSVVTGAVALLLYFEQIAVIYVLATLSLTVLLIIVAFSDLENVGRENFADQAETGQIKVLNNHQSDVPSARPEGP